MERVRMSDGVELATWRTGAATGRRAPELILIGHSFGATLAFAYAAEFPSRARAVGYLSGLGTGDWRTLYRAERERRRRPYSDRLDRLGAKERTRVEEVEWRRLSWAHDYADHDHGFDLARGMAESENKINFRAPRTRPPNCCTS